MASKTISQQKVSELSSLMVDHLAKKLETIKEQTRLKIESSLVGDYPKDILELFKTNPRFIKESEGISIYSRDTKKNYLFTVYPNLPIYPDKDVNVSKAFEKPNGLRYQVIEDLVKEYIEVENKKTQLRSKIKCTLNTLKSYARIKNEFPEAYKLLVEKIDKEVLNVDDPCTDIESLRAELTVK